MAGALALLGWSSGVASPMLAENRDRGLQSDAYFYTEAGDVRELLGEGGR